MRQHVVRIGRYAAGGAEFFDDATEQAIAQRHDAIEELLKHPDALEEVGHKLAEVHDLERLLARLAKGILGPRELSYVARTHGIAMDLVAVAERAGLGLAGLAAQSKKCTGLSERIEATLADEPPVSIQKGDAIRPGAHPELDRLRAMLKDSKGYLLEMQQREVEATGISSLKVAYNNVFGYYLEVRNTHKDKVPEGWIRKQTLTNAERYITPELKEFEDQILGAEEKIQRLELEIYQELVVFVSGFLADLQTNARLLARLDVLAGFAFLAREKGYCRPTFSTNATFDIV